MCNCTEAHAAGDVPPGSTPIVIPEVPLASPVPPIGQESTPEDALGSSLEDDALDAELSTELTRVPHLPLCRLDFRDGCYALTIVPTGSTRPLRGTLRVDRAAPNSGADGLILSGDLYRMKSPLGTVGEITEVAGARISTTATSAAASASIGTSIISKLRPRIPIFARGQYHSYLKGTRLSAPVIGTGKTCRVTIDAEQFDYTHPPVGQHKGSFPSSASRTVRFVLKKVPAPFPASLSGGPYFEGRMYVSGVDRGSVTLAWVSRFLRRAVLEIDTLTGSVPPQRVPHPSGTGTEYFDTVFAQAGWQLSVVEDQVNIPVPSGVNANTCWSSSNLHALMTAVRKPTTNLDTEWRTHLVVVPAAMGCSRGVMYDIIGVPREGSASFSDDGYPTSHSSNFGAAANQIQRNVPRAYLRSATHEVTHAFNQIHQEQETAADNSIMTTTPSVADVLGGPATGAPGVFPDQINLGFNATVRNHLAHMPDPVVRPGGWPFASWFGSPGTPQAADHEQFDDSEVSLAVTTEPAHAAFGEPITVTWTMTNNTDVDLMVPNDVSLEGLFANITVTDNRGRARAVRPFTILCENSRLEPLAPGDSRQASHRAFWSSEGFAFERPGRHVVEVAVAWSAAGTPVAACGSTEVWVDYPLNDAENQAAALVMHPEVGKFVALDGGATHLEEAVDRLSSLAGSGGAAADMLGMADSASGAAVSKTRVAGAFAGLLGGPRRGGGGTSDSPGFAMAGGAKKAPAKKKAAAKKAATTKATAKKTTAKKAPAKRR